MICNGKMETNIREKQEELQRILVDAENYKRQAEEVVRRVQMIMSSREEIGTAKKALMSLKAKKRGTEVLIPIGADSYIIGELRNIKSVIIDIGANISLEKSVEETIEILERRDRELEHSIQKFQRIASQINTKLLELDSRSREIMRELQTERELANKEK